MVDRKVILRADGNPSIGMGHFYRSLALSEMLNDQFECIFATRTPSDYQKNEINKVCRGIIELPEDDRHFDCFLEYINGNEIVVLDNYYYDTSYQQKIKDKGCKLISIDDLHDKHYVADVVINHAEGLSKSEFSKEYYTKLCLGFKYALLRGAFFREIQHTNKKNDLLISLGGADPYDISKKIVDLLEEDRSINKISIILGSAYNGKLLQCKNPILEINVNLDANEIAWLMAESKFGFFSSSTIAMEAIAMRLPFATGYFVDNQTEIYKGISDFGLGFPLGSLMDLNKDKVKSLLFLLNNKESVIEKIIKNQINQFDKKSPKRILQLFKSL